MEPLNEFFSWNLRHYNGGDERLMTEEELQELFDRMEADNLPDTAMTMGQADGYMTALIVGPEPVMLHLWMEIIFGQPTLPLAEDPAAQTRLLQLLRHRYLDIQLRLATPRSQITTDNLFTPLHADVDPGDCITPYQLDADGLRRGDWTLRDWAQGFRTAVSEDLSWDELIEDPDDYHLISPIVLFDLGHNPDRPEQQIDQDDAFAQLLITTLYELMAWWRDPHRRAVREQLARMPLLRQSVKVGRNDPCPCGSGKKYKKCCGA